jgi:hypothetical protein
LAVLRPKVAVAPLHDRAHNFTDIDNRSGML